MGRRIILIIGTILLAMLLLGQTMSLIHYEFSVLLGLQEAQSIVGEMGIAINKAFGAADTIMYIPILALGLVGIWRQKRWSIVAMSGALGITAYWPIVCLFLLFFAKGTPDFHFTRYTSYTIMLTLITLYGLWGLWYLYTHPLVFTNNE
jgi:hypothetical protein